MENLLDTQGLSFNEWIEKMDSNGESHFHLDNYKAKNNLPCFASYGSEDLEDLESYQSMYKAVYDKLYKDEDMTIEVLIEEYVFEGDVKGISFEDSFKAITKLEISEFVSNFLDSYFLGGYEVWCSIHTKIDEFYN